MLHGLVATDYIEARVLVHGYGSVPPLAAATLASTSDYFEAVHLF